MLTIEKGKPITFAISGPGIDLVTDSSTNTVATFGSVTVLEKANRCYDRHAVIRINDQSGAALSSPGDNIDTSKLVLTLERKVTGIYGSYQDTVSGRDLIDEPTNDGQFTGTLDVTVARLKDSVNRAKIKANTSRKMDIVITGTIIEGAIPYMVTIQLPNLKPTKNSNPHKAGMMENSQTFTVLAAATAPTGMTGITDPLWISITNKITTDLAAV